MIRILAENWAPVLIYPTNGIKTAAETASDKMVIGAV